MTKLQHTPGPWSKDYKSTKGHIKTLCDIKNHTKTVCKYRYNLCEEILPESEIEANGLLIAAAPEMLEALIKYYKIIFYKIIFPSYGSNFDLCEIKMSEAKELIEKATGLTIEEVLSK